MLKIFAENLKGEVRELENLISLVLEREEGVAGDLLTLTLEGGVYEEIVSLTLLDGDGKVFSGIVDEQNVTVSQNETTELVARSMGALLIDNEAYPQSFVNPDMRLIFERYVKPFGVKSYTGENKAFSGEFRVRKGMSCYKVLEDFCLSVYGVYPRIEGNILVLKSTRDKILFSNRHGVPFEKLMLSKVRAKPISLVRVKVKEDGDYGTLIKNPYAIDRKIIRERYFNGALSTGKSIRTVYDAIKRSNTADGFVKITSPQRLTQVLGAVTEIDFDGFHTEEKLYVSSLRYSLSNLKESTEIILKKESNYVDNAIYE